MLVEGVKCFSATETTAKAEARQVAKVIVARPTLSTGTTHGHNMRNSNRPLPVKDPSYNNRATEPAYTYFEP